MNSAENRRRRSLAALIIPAMTLLILAGCHYSLLNHGSSLAAWSPDGSQLAVCIDNADSDSGELWLVEPDSGRTTRLLAGERSPGLPHLLAPRWSPDGKTLYCARTTAGEEDQRRPASIVGIDLESGQATEAGVIHYTGSRVIHFAETQAFIPLVDGTLAAQDLGEDNLYRLVRIDPISKTRTALAPCTGGWMVISGSLDGEYLAVAVPQPQGSGMRISLYTATGKQLSHPVELWEGGNEGPAAAPSLTWSPTAQQLAVMVEGVPPVGSKWSLSTRHVNSGPEEDDLATLIIIEPHTGQARPVAHDLFGIPPIYSPDGTHLAYAANAGIRDSDGDVLLEVRVQPRVGDSRETSLPGLALPLAWSADSSKLAYYLGQPDDDNTGSVISVSPNGSGTRVVSTHQQDRLAVAAPGGGRLAWVSGDGAVQVLDPGSGRVLFHDGLTVTGTLQAGEDHLRQGQPEAALTTCSTLDSTVLDSEKSARRAAVSYASLRALHRTAEAAGVLNQAFNDLPATDEPALALLTLGGALSDFGFRTEAERLVEEQLLVRYPESDEAVDALWALAALKQSEGDTEASLGHLGRLLRSYPEERKEPTRALLLAALAEAGQSPPLIAELAGMIIDANPGSTVVDQAAPRAVAHYARGLAFEHGGSREQAREAFAAALAERATVNLSDGRDVEDLCWEALFRLARDETARR